MAGSSVIIYFPKYLRVENALTDVCSGTWHIYLWGARLQYL